MKGFEQDSPCPLGASIEVGSHEEIQSIKGARRGTAPSWRGVREGILERKQKNR